VSRGISKRVQRLEVAAGIVTRRCKTPCIACLLAAFGEAERRGLSPVSKPFTGIALEICDGVSHWRTLDDILSGRLEREATKD
jgi:hypothetical protein